ncbi:serine protease [Candidatus Uhrbacteria bacterium]|nr:serine protease [Candidatus Uhrbacteria bacterium]
MKKHIIHMSHRLSLIVLFIAISIGGGALGGYWISQQASYEDLSQIKGYERGTVIIDERPRENGDGDARDVSETLSSSMLEVYNQKKIKNLGNPDLLDTVLTSDDFRAFALALTSDGWILMPPTISAYKAESLFVRDREGNTYTVSKMVPDPAIGCVYAKINAVRLRPIEFMREPYLLRGEKAYRLTHFTALESLDVSGPAYSTYETVAASIQSTAVLSKMYNPNVDFGSVGQPIVGRDKRLIGISAKKGIIPSSYIQDGFARVLRGSQAQRPQIALNYIDNAWVARAGGQVAAKQHNGATIIVDKRRGYSVKTKDGKATLQYGDSVISINDESIDSNRSFSEVLQQYKTGDSITLKIQRNSKLISLPIIVQ